jgi:uncharacterized protein YbaR (Trm112 family)
MTTLPAWVREALCCPACHATLEDEVPDERTEGPSSFICRRCSLAYPVIDGIPRLLAAEARQL